MNDHNRYSRVNKFEKRRKNTKAISILVIIGSSLLVLLIGLMLVSGKNDTSTKEDNSHKLGVDERNENDKYQNDNNSNSIESSAHDDLVSGQEESNDRTPEESANHNNSSTHDESNLEKDQDESSEISTETAESTDDNIIEVLTENWEPVGTIQEGTHTIDYNNGTQDRIEMNQAVSVATGLSEENIETWWVGNNGDQKVRLTVSDRGENEIYRVYLSWIDNNGWQPTKVERLKVNDAK